jgi:hypothetical protein
MHYILDVSIATQYDVNVAIFLNNIAFWTKTNAAHEKHFHDGRYWTYNSLPAFTKLFPFWSVRQVRTVIERCVSEGLLVKGNYHESKNMQSLWYALTDKGLDMFHLPKMTNGQNGDEPLSTLTRTPVKADSSTITDINTNIKQIDPPPKKLSTAKTKSEAKTIPDDFQPSANHEDIASQYGLNIKLELDSFRDWAMGANKKNVVVKQIDWSRTFSNWLRNSVKWSNKSSVVKQDAKKQSIDDKKLSFPPKDSLCQALVFAVHYREFSHPIVYLLLEKIGSWAIRTDSEFDMKVKISRYYGEVCQEYSDNQESVKNRMVYFKENNSFMPKANSFISVKRPEYLGTNMAGRASLSL